MQPVDDVELCQGLVRALAQLVPRLFERHRVGAGISRLQSREGTEQATRHADVGGLEPQVVIEVGARTVPRLAFAVRQPAHSKQIAAGEQPHAVLEREPFAGPQLRVDIEKIGLCQAGLHGTCQILACYTAAQQPAKSAWLVVDSVCWGALRAPRPLCGPSTSTRLPRKTRITVRHRPAEQGSGCEAHTVPPL